MQVLQKEHKEQLTNEKVIKPIPWFANDEEIDHETLFLYRKEAGQNCLLDKFTIDLGMMPTFEDFQFAVKELHGGGIYEASTRNLSGTYAKRLYFSLAGFPKKPKEEQPQAVAQAESSTDKLLAFLVQSQQRSEERMLQVLDKLAEKPPVPEADPFLMVERVAKLLGTTGATPPVPKSTLDTLIEAKQIQELLGSHDLAPTADGWGAITAALVPLSEVLKENTINERLKLHLAHKQLQNKAPVPPAVPVNVPQVVQTIPAPKYAALAAELKPVLAQIVPYAEQNAAPSAIAEGLLGIVPDKAALFEFLSRDDALNDMARLEPKIANHWDWFTELANALIDQIEQVQPNDTGTSTETAAPVAPVPKVETIGGSTGNTENAATHGKTGKTRTRKPVNQGAVVGASETA